MEITAVIEYILTVAQSLDSEDYQNKSLIMIVVLTGVLFCGNEQTLTKWPSFVQKNTPTWMRRESRRGLTATSVKRVTT